MNVWEVITDLAQKDVLSGFVTSYMTGQMEISCIRSIAERELGRHFTWRSFITNCFDRGSCP